MKEVTAEAETVPATATKSKAAKKIISRPSTARATLLRTKEGALIPGPCQA